MKYPFVDLDLARRLERTEATSNACFVESRAVIAPTVGATWMEVAGAYAMFDGAESPVTQTFGLGIFEAPDDHAFDTMERFFESRGAATYHEVSPLAGMETVEALNRRGYEPFELSSVLFRPLDPAVTLDADPRVAVRVARREEAELWASVSARGWSETPGLEEFMQDLGRVLANARNCVTLLAEVDGQPAAAGAMSMHGGVAILAGASTVPEFRRRGAQLALLEARLRMAAEHGCDLAMMAALPGSNSQRNAERQGFRIAYTRMKWRKR